MVLLDKQIKTKDLLPKMETRTPSDARIYIFSIFENNETLKEKCYHFLVLYYKFFPDNKKRKRNKMY